MSPASFDSSRRRSAGLSHGVSLHVHIRSLSVVSATGRLRFYPCPLHNDGYSVVDADCNRGTAAPVRRTLPNPGRPLRPARFYSHVRPHSARGGTYAGRTVVSGGERSDGPDLGFHVGSGARATADEEQPHPFVFHFTEIPT